LRPLGYRSDVRAWLVPARISLACQSDARSARRFGGAYGGSGGAIGAIFSALVFPAIGNLLFVFNLDSLRRAVSGPGCCSPPCRSARRGCSRSTQPAGADAVTGRAASLAASIDRPVAVAFGCVIALLLAIDPVGDPDARASPGVVINAMLLLYGHESRAK
jgi:hypothetical protein